MTDMKKWTESLRPNEDIPLIEETGRCYCGNKVDKLEDAETGGVQYHCLGCGSFPVDCDCQSTGEVSPT